MTAMDPFPKRIPRAPGAWMRRALVQRYLATVIVRATGLGALVLWVALGAVPASAETVATGLFLAWGPACVASLLVVRHGFRNYGEENLEKVFEAETLIGRRIEAAITRPIHAVAHNVEIEGAEPGDIDHIVATPGGLVVVESKFADVPEDRFPRVRRGLRRTSRPCAHGRRPAHPCTERSYTCTSIIASGNTRRSARTFASTSRSDSPGSFARAWETRPRSPMWSKCETRCFRSRGGFGDSRGEEAAADEGFGRGRRSEPVLRWPMSESHP